MYSPLFSKIKCILILIILSLILTSTSGKSKQKRALIFTPTSLYGALVPPTMRKRLIFKDFGWRQTLALCCISFVYMGFITFVAMAVPIDLPNKNVFVSYNFEANYAVVTNITEIDEVIFPNLPVISSRQSRSITRELAYTVLESRFAEYGMKGRECMLRNICEAAETPLHHNGILGHLMHVIFTPSASREEGLDDEYYEAEASGHRGDCDKYVEECPTSLFDYITRLVEFPPQKT